MDLEIKRLSGYSKETILAELKRVAKKLGKDTLSVDDIKKNARINPTTVIRKFGSLTNARRLAGLREGKHYNIDKEDLLKELDRIWNQIGHQPMVRDLRKYRSKFSSNSYRRRFGSWIKTCESYVEWKNRPSGGFPKIEEVIKMSRPPRPNAPSLTVEYGEPIDFLGLRHAPINEQGVVYLFGVLSKSLGFTVEAIRSDFPDCEAKREIPGKKGRWERVAIEFEFKSSNFKQHGHNPSDCNIVVCWDHDLPECPLEVISLKDIMVRMSKTE